LAGQYPRTAERPEAGVTSGEWHGPAIGILTRDADEDWGSHLGSVRGKEPGVEAWVVRQRLGSDVRDLYADVHRQLDRLLLPRVMEYARGSQHQAALLLGIARQTLRLKLRDLGLSITRPTEADEEDTA